MSGGTIYLYNSTDLTITQNAQKLGASLVIGQTKTGSDSAATLDLSTAAIGMSGNLTLYNNATITNMASGVVNFNQSVNSDVKGGIAKDAASTGSTITNKGTMNRTTVDGTKALVITPAVTQNDDNALFTLGPSCSISFAPGGFDVNKGKFKMGKLSHQTGATESGTGKIEMDPTGGTGPVNFYIDGDLTTDGGFLTFDYTPGAWGVLNVSGDLTVAGGTEVDVNVDGSTSGTSDQIVVAGSRTLTSGVVDVSAQNASAPGGYTYTILTSTSGISGTWGTSLANAGSNPDNWAWDSMSQGILDCTSPPVVTGISPSSGPTTGGTSVTITGNGFIGVTGVSFGGFAATSFTVTSSTSITAVAPANMAGTVDVTVTGSYGTSATSSADQFTYVAVPVVSGVMTSSGPTTGGTSVSISGSGFTGATAVFFGGAAATSFTVNSDGSITAVSPAGSAGTVDITVVTAAGTSATSISDHFTYIAVPVVTAISPSSGSHLGGTSVTISGSGFTGATSVLFGGTDALWFTVNSDGSITVTSPNSFFTGTVDITVVTADGTSATSSDDHFTYT